MLPGLVWTRLVSLREWWEESEQELFAPDVEPGLTVWEVTGDLSPCWDSSHGPGTISTQVGQVTGARGCSLWVLFVGVRFLLCPRQDPVQGWDRLCSVAGLPLLPCCSPGNIFCSVWIIS